MHLYITTYKCGLVYPILENSEQRMSADSTVLPKGSKEHAIQPKWGGEGRKRAHTHYLGIDE